MSKNIGLEHLEERVAPAAGPVLGHAAGMSEQAAPVETATSVTLDEATVARREALDALFSQGNLRSLRTPAAAEQREVRSEAFASFDAVTPEITIEGYPTIGAIQTISEDAEDAYFTADYDPETRIITAARDDAETFLAVRFSAVGGELVALGDNTFFVPEGVRSVTVSFVRGNLIGTLDTSEEAEANGVGGPAGQSRSITISYEQAGYDDPSNTSEAGPPSGSVGGETGPGLDDIPPGLDILSGGGDVVEDPVDGPTDDPVENPIEIPTAAHPEEEADQSDPLNDIAVANVLAQEQDALGWNAPLPAAKEERKDADRAEAAQAQDITVVTSVTAPQDTVHADKREQSGKRPALGANDKEIAIQEDRDLTIKDLVFGALAAIPSALYARLRWGKRKEKVAAR